jgi:hypothetical protein
MMLAHYAAGFAAKRAAPRTSLTVLVVASALLDIIFPPLVLLGMEKVRIDPGNTAFTPFDFMSYPISHSLLMTLVWAGLFAWAYHARTRYARGALLVGLAVTSHWVLDLLSHRPDMPLAPGLPVKLGLGLWNSVPGTIVAEVGLFALGVWLYLRTTRARGWPGHVSLWSLVAVLALAFVGTAQGAPPPSIEAMGLVSIAIVIVQFFWLVWIDRTRELRPAVVPGPR